MSAVQRVANLSIHSFVADYLITNKPMIVTDAMNQWAALGLWTPDYFRDRFGDSEVQVYDDLFTLEDISTLQSYLDQNFDMPPDFIASAYVRWYAKFKDVEFCWADDAFRELAADWANPYFLPRSCYCLPYIPSPATVSPERDSFPFRGIFISGRGARTRLHRDPIGTQAILCQFYGEKSIRFYPPSPGGQTDLDDSDAAFAVNFHRPDAPAAEDVLRPGEVIFIPEGWYHEVTSLSDSISVTWNFVHQARADAFFCALRAARPGDIGHDVVRYFLAGHLAESADAKEMLALLRSPHGEAANKSLIQAGSTGRLG